MSYPKNQALQDLDLYFIIYIKYFSPQPAACV